MDLAYDPDKAAQFDCANCDKKLQKLRNCDGKGSPALNELNGRIYPRCPRAISLENQWAVYVVNMYFKCKQLNILPFPGSLGEQTKFQSEVFDFLDELSAKQSAKQNKPAK